MIAIIPAGKEPRDLVAGLHGLNQRFVGMASLRAAS